MGLTGGCLCGAVRYELTAEPLASMNCHCKNCQRQAGSAFSTIIGVPEGGVSVTGEPRTYVDHGDSGGRVQRQFCGNCGSPLFSIVDSAPGMVWIKAGTLDDTSTFKPAMNIYAKSKQAWLDLGEAPAFETLPDGM